MYFKIVKSESIEMNPNFQFGEAAFKRVSIEDTFYDELDNKDNLIVNDY
jgi:hypothetical protein